ncbi:MAG: hypothetical protein SH850_06720 [Planctomycetaceae bacterium]|nr:hypothetical protein [Planctomycetaceae bacterium]
MIAPNIDDRTAERRARDEAIAAEPLLPPPELPAGAQTSSVETHFARRRRPVALAGIVENGLVRPLDASIKLAESSRVIIVTSE